MKRYELSTALLNHIMCVGTYDSILDGNFDYEYAVENFLENHPNFEGNEYPLNFDRERNESVIIDALGEVLDDEVKPFLQDFGVQEIAIGGWYHPQYYKFSTDSLDLTFEVADNFLEIASQKIASWKDNKDILDYIERCYKSHSGFWSWSPESIEELATEIRSENPSVQAVGEYITLLLHENFGDEYIQCLLENIYIENATDLWYVDESIKVA